MRTSLLLVACAAVFATGCAETREIYFYRGKDINGGRPIQVDIIYPQNEQEWNKLREISPADWFGSSDLFDKVAKEQFDVAPCTGSANDCNSVKRLEKKPKGQQWLVIIAELGKRPEGTAASPGQKQIITLEKKPDKPKKREYIRINQGYIERLDKKPRD